MTDSTAIALEEVKSTDLQTRRHPWLPLAALLGAALLWGGSFAGMRFVLQGVNLWSTMWLRMAIALVLILPLAGRLRNLDYRRGDWKWLLAMVLLQPCLYFFLESNALKLTTSSQAGVISATVPILVSVGAVWLLGESMGRWSILGIALSVAGVVGLTLAQGQQAGAQRPLAGNALELCAMVCAAGNMLLVKRLSQRYNAWALTAMQVVAGAIFFLPGLWFLVSDPTLRLTPALVYTLIFLGGGVSLGAFGLYNWGMSQIPAGKASIFINLVPVVAILLGWLVMGEVLVPVQWVAAAAVICGVWVSQSPAETR